MNSDMTGPPSPLRVSHNTPAEAESKLDAQPQIAIERGNTKYERMKTKASQIGATCWSVLASLASGTVSLWKKGVSGDMEPNLPPIGAKAKGEVISQIYKHDGKVVLTELATRTNIVKIMEKGLNDKKNNLLAQISDLNENDPKMKGLVQKLEVVNRQLELVKTKSRTTEETWANSLYYRSLTTQTTEAVGNFYDGFKNLEQMQVFLEELNTAAGNGLTEAQQQLGQQLLPDYKPEEGKESLIKQLGWAITWQQGMLAESPYAERLPKSDGSPEVLAPKAIGDLQTSHTYLQATIQLYAQLTGRSDPTRLVTVEQAQLATRLLPGYSPLGGRESLLNQLQAAINERTSVVASKETYVSYLPACANLRKQEVLEGTEGPVLSSITRSAAISDFHNSHTNLQEMESFREELKVQPRTRTPEELLETGKKILPGFEPAEGLEALADQMDLAILERTALLECQGLQDLAVHFEGLERLQGPELEAWLQESSCDYTRYSMLNGQKTPKNDRGQLMNEPNQILDMAALYGHWDGATLVFDGKGPYRDEEGNIHIGVKVLDAEGNPAQKTLDATYWNVSTTDNLENVPPQKEINDKALDKLKDKLEVCCEALEEGYNTVFVKNRDLPANRQIPLTDQQVSDWNTAQNLRARLRSIEATLDVMPKTHGFDLLADIASLTEDVNKTAKPNRPNFTFFVGINCFSGKDRSGELTAMFTTRIGKARAEALKMTTNAVNRFVEYVGKETMSPEGIFYGVIEDNVGHKAIKLFFRDNPLLRAKGFGKVMATVTQMSAWKNALKLVATERFHLSSRVNRTDQLS